MRSLCDTTIAKKPMMQWMLKITDYADRLLEDLNGLDWPEKVKNAGVKSGLKFLMFNCTHI